MSDRLEEIKTTPHKDYRTFYNGNVCCNVCWLIAEVERLREKNDRQVFYGQRALDVAEDIVALRGALQALVDAVDDNEFAGFFTARAAAVALLAGPGGET